MQYVALILVILPALIFLEYAAVEGGEAIWNNLRSLSTWMASISYTQSTGMNAKLKVQNPWTSTPGSTLNSLPWQTDHTSTVYQRKPLEWAVESTVEWNHGMGSVECGIVTWNNCLEQSANITTLHNGISRWNHGTATWNLSWNKRAWNDGISSALPMESPLKQTWNLFRGIMEYSRGISTEIAMESFVESTRHIHGISHGIHDGMVRGIFAVIAVESSMEWNMEQPKWNHGIAHGITME